MATNPSFPNNLRNVRQSRRLSVQQVADELKTTTDRLLKFEDGVIVPTAAQYDALQKIYGVPDYVLAGEEKPQLREPVVDLRQSVATPLQISPKGWKSYFARLDTVELIDSLAESLQLNPTLKRPSNITKKNVANSYNLIQSLIQFDPSDSRWIEHPDLAFRFLRAKIEDFGIYCFLTDAPAGDFRGLFDRISDRASLILINKRTFKTKARIFTLAHELAHYLIELEGVSDPAKVDHSAELACNQFASKFLAPPSLIDRLITKGRKHSTSESGLISYVSKRCLLSQGAVAYRLREDGVISDKDYTSWFRANGLSPGYDGQLTAEEMADETEGSGGNWAYNVVTDLGFRPLEIVRRAWSQGVIDDVHVAHILNARGPTQAKVFKTAKDRLSELGL